MAQAQTRPIANRSVWANSEALLGLGVVGTLLILTIPLPTPLLDGFLSLNITLAVLILLISMYALKPLSFSSFPSLLLVTTLFRLALNVASTRLILLHGHEGTDAAGRVIESFGQFVVGGNFVVGIIIFLILVLVNFIVITRGATRIAEVAARFTLDAMPGKQMSIDADINSGLITEAEARERRREISREADFYGAMDGASKFVRGDAIAGLVITFINIIGGLAIGAVQRGLPIGEAVKTYTLLTVGDGLVAAIPALMISTAAGIIVSRTVSEGNLGRDILGQITAYPRAIAIAAVILLGLGAVPGLPTLPFLLLGSLAGIYAYRQIRTSRVKDDKERERRAKEKAEGATPERVEALLPLDLLELEVGYGLIPLVDQEQGGRLLDRIKSIRRQLALDLGLIVPPLHIRDNLQLQPAEYAILLKGVEIARGELMVGHLLAMDPGTVEKPIEGIRTQEPAFGLPALWVPERDQERAQFAGYTVVDLSTVVATHITELIKRHAHELLGRQEVQSLLDNLAKSCPKVVEDLIPQQLSLGQVQRVMQNLLREQVSIRDLRTILETLGDFAPITKDVEVLTEYARQALGRAITRQHQTPEGTLPVMTIDPRLEEIVASAVRRAENGSYLDLEPRIAQDLLSKVHQAAERFTATGHQPVLLTSPAVRSHLKRLTQRFLPGLVVLSHNEVAQQVRVQSLGSVS